MIRVIATDLDGTLLDDDGRVSPRNREAFRQARIGGVKVAVVTARSHYTATPILEDLVEVDGAVCSNGATLFEPSEKKVLKRHPIDPVAVAGLVAAVLGGLPGACFGWETVDGLVWERDFAALHPRPGAVLVERAWVDDGSGGMNGVEVSKVLIAHPDLVGHDLLDELTPHLGHEVTASNSGAEFVEITAAGVDKALGLRLLCEEWGVPATEVVAFGDQVNDIPMLTWAGTGIAMANAHPAVLAAADRSTASNRQDGVAQAVEMLTASRAE